VLDLALIKPKTGKFLRRLWIMLSCEQNFTITNTVHT
jgi:hypothetical protein